MLWQAARDALSASDPTQRDYGEKVMKTKTRKFFEKRVNQLNSKMRKKGRLSESDLGKLVYFEKRLAQDRNEMIERAAFDYAISKDEPAAPQQLPQAA